MRPPDPKALEFCIPEGGTIRGYEIVMIIRAAPRWTSYLAKDDKGNRITITYLEKEKMLERFKFFAYQNGVPLEHTENEALGRIAKYEQELIDSVNRIKGLGNEHVATTYGCTRDIDRNEIVLISEYTPGIELDYLCNRLNPKQVIFLFAQVLKGLDFIHSSGFLHLNVKPSRIFVNVEGEPPIAKLTNFGFAVPKTGYTGEITGTLLYMPPEVILDKRHLISEKSDLYSFGVTMYYCLTGHHPTENRLEGEIDRQKLKGIVEYEPPFHAPPSHYNKNVSAELDAAILGALEKEPEKRRFETAKQMLKYFRETWPEESANFTREGTSTLVDFD